MSSSRIHISRCRGGDVYPETFLQTFLGKASKRHSNENDRSQKQAKLFVVPLLLNASEVSPRQSTKCQRLPSKWVWSRFLIEFTIFILETSPWYERNKGIDHIVVTSHFAYFSPRVKVSRPYLTHRFRNLYYHNFTPSPLKGEHIVNSPNYCPHLENDIPRITMGLPVICKRPKSADFALIIATQKDNKRKFDDRRRICD